jgi:PAS domain S-box-containing protein/putative nucleotidyltransferase with HDIG domain
MRTDRADPSTEQRAHVLVVDDEESIVRLFVRALQSAGYVHVHGITDPTQVPAYLDRDTPDLVILDLNMPGMDGFSLLREISTRLGEDSFLPVMAVSGLASPEAKERAFREGAKDYLVKPIEIKELLLHVSSLLETRFLGLRLHEKQAELADLVGRRTEELQRSIAETREVEKALGRSEERFYRAFASNPGLSTISELESGRLIDVNEAWLGALGFTREEVLGRSVDELGIASREERESYVRAGAKDSPGGAVEIKVRTKAGNLTTMMFSSEIVEFEDRTCVLATAIDISRRKAAEESLQEAYARLSRAQSETLQALGAVTEFRDPYTAGHQQRVARIAVAIARRLGYSPSSIEGLHNAAIVHDIGKVAVPIEILASPIPLTPVQSELVHAHASAGFSILKEINFDQPIAEIVRQHHERLDGSGYPRGLKADEILPEARVLAVADTVEAMITHRPYRPALGIQAALDEVVNNKGVLYDSAAVDALLQIDMGELLRETEANSDQLELRIDDACKQGLPRPIAGGEGGEG